MSFKVHLPLQTMVQHFKGIHYYNTMYQKLKDWCEDNELSLVYIIMHNGDFYFEKECDAILFELTWC